MTDLRDTLQSAPKLREARALFTKAVGIDSTYARAWAGLAESIALLPDYGDTTRTSLAFLEEAVVAAQRAMALDSAAADVRLAQARLLSGQFRLADALRAVDGAIASDSTSLFAWHLKARLLSGLGHQEAAGVALRQALALDRLAPVVHMERSQWFLNSRMNDSAIASAERAVALASDEPRWTFLLSASYIAGWRTDDAVRLCSARRPRDWCTTMWRGLAGDPAYTSAALAIAKRVPRGSLTLSEGAGLFAQLGGRRVHRVATGHRATGRQRVRQHRQPLFRVDAPGSALGSDCSRGARGFDSALRRVVRRGAAFIYPMRRTGPFALTWITFARTDRKTTLRVCTASKHHCGASSRQTSAPSSRSRR